MKVSIVTILDNVNIGSYLQAFALAKSIENIGHHPEYLDYSRSSRDTKHILLKGLFTMMPWKWYGLIKNCLNRDRIIAKQRPFIKSYLSAKRYVGFEAVAKNPPEADIYVTGSDQVWNSKYNKGIDRTFYLDYAPKGKKKISYAASIGMSNIPNDESPIMSELLNRYEAISLRESSSIDLLTSIGVDKEKLSVVLDPTLLLNKEQWSKYACKCPLNEPYVLIYSVEKNTADDLIRLARKVAAKKKLKVVYLASGQRGAMKGIDYLIDNASPEQFLAYFLNASFTVVSSFHGTAFSVNFQKDFITVMPKQFNSRVDSLMALCDLEKRKCYDVNEDVEKYFEHIDYISASELLEQDRIKSIQFLKNVLN